MDAETPIQEKPIIVGGINTSLTPRQFYRGDPYLVFVKDKLRLDDIWNTAIFFVLAIAIDFSFDIFFLKDYHPTASLLDALRLLLLCTALTSAYLIYLLLPSFMAETFDTLNANGVIGTHRQNSSKSVSYESFVEKLLAWANSRWWLAIIAMITVLYGFQWMFVQYPHIPLFWNIFVFLVGNMLVVYIICFILIRVILLLVFINRLFFSV